MLNKTILQGRLVADPELKATQSGVSYLEVTVAWSEKYKETETRCFLRCKAWRNTAEFISKYFRKGQEILIEGRMITETWDKDGEKQSRTICNVEKANFCGPASKMSEKTDNSEVDKWVSVPDGDDEELPFT